MPFSVGNSTTRAMEELLWVLHYFFQLGHNFTNCSTADNFSHNNIVGKGMDWLMDLLW
ncbi:hypothetical protein SOVF_064190 [Spinacia oleracea]|nr:hypothetical protein SOVF_064190 [Spinacia oleracea]